VRIDKKRLIMPDLSFLSTVTFAHLRVTFKALEPLVLPEYKGSAFRGCLGETLKQQVCTSHGKLCGTCSQRFGCPFSRLYNSFTEPRHPHARKFPNSPHPYIIEPMPGSKTFFGPGETFWFNLILVGSAIELFPVLATALGKMGPAGIGKSRGKFFPTRVEHLINKGEFSELGMFKAPEKISCMNLVLPKAGNRLTLGFETPLRLKKGGELLDSPPPFSLFTARLAQRLGLLAHFHCGAPWPEIPKEGMEEVTIYNSRLQWTDWRRYSGTQETTMNFDGFTGEITYEGNFTPWAPLIAAGVWLHAGLTATFGLGKFRIN
jgi:hypothetical protein